MKLSGSNHILFEPRYSRNIYHDMSYCKTHISYLLRRVSIIRGRVVTPTGQGVIGVRVSVGRTKDAPNYGFTLTRPGGW